MVQARACISSMEPFLLTSLQQPLSESESRLGKLFSSRGNSPFCRWCLESGAVRKAKIAQPCSKRDQFCLIRSIGDYTPKMRAICSWITSFIRHLVCCEGHPLSVIAIPSMPGDTSTLTGIMMQSASNWRSRLSGDSRLRGIQHSWAWKLEHRYRLRGIDINLGKC